MTTGMATKPDRIKEKLNTPEQKSEIHHKDPSKQSSLRRVHFYFYFYFKNSVFLFSCRCTCGVLKDGAIWLLARGDMNAQVAPGKRRCVANL